MKVRGSDKREREFLAASLALQPQSNLEDISHVQQASLLTAHTLDLPSPLLLKPLLADLFTIL